MLRQRQTPRCLLGAQKDRHKARRPQDGRRGPSKRTGIILDARPLVTYRTGVQFRQDEKDEKTKKDRHHPRSLKPEA